MNSISNYQFIDALRNAQCPPFQSHGAIYYGLKQVDYDGNFEYSKIVAVSLNEEEEVKIFPNPFNDEITINNNFLTNESLQAEIFDITGRRILAQTISATETKMDLSTIQISGIYFLKVNGKVFKLIKN